MKAAVIAAWHLRFISWELHTYVNPFKFSIHNASYSCFKSSTDLNRLPACLKQKINSILTKLAFPLIRLYVKLHCMQLIHLVWFSISICKYTYIPFHVIDQWSIIFQDGFHFIRLEVFKISLFVQRTRPFHSQNVIHFFWYSVNWNCCYEWTQK